jgi:hypothetical protein
MRRWLLSVALLICPIAAGAATASDSSIEELLAITKAEQAVDATFALVERQMQQGIQQSVSGKVLSEEQHRKLDEGVSRFIQTVRGEFTWQTVKPMYIQAYRETFEQAEVDGIIAFYRSAAGQAYATKLPILSQKMNAATQAHLQQLIPKIREGLRTVLSEAGVQ